MFAEERTKGLKHLANAERCFSKCYPEGKTGDVFHYIEETLGSLVKYLTYGAVYGPQLVACLRDCANKIEQLTQDHYDPVEEK